MKKTVLQIIADFLGENRKAKFDVKTSKKTLVITKVEKHI